MTSGGGNTESPSRAAAYLAGAVRRLGILNSPWPKREQLGLLSPRRNHSAEGRLRLGGGHGVPSPHFIAALLLLTVIALSLAWCWWLANQVPPLNPDEGMRRLADWRPDISECAPLYDNGVANDYAACVGYK